MTTGLRENSGYTSEGQHAAANEAINSPSDPLGGRTRYAHRLARGIRAGRWLFATGQAATDYVHGIAPEVLQSGHPFDGPSKAHREARRLFQNVDEVSCHGRVKTRPTWSASTNITPRRTSSLLTMRPDESTSRADSAVDI